MQASGWMWMLGLVACGGPTASSPKASRHGSISNLARDESEQPTQARNRPLLIRVTTDRGEGHDARFTAYGEQVRPIFLEWEPAIVACAKNSAPLEGAFDLAVIVDGDGTIVDQFLINTHLDEPGLNRDDAAFASCVTALVRAHREPFPPTSSSTPAATLISVRYPYRLSGPAN